MAEFQRDPGVVAYEAFTGLRNDVPANRFALGDLVTGTNVDIDETGGLTRRAGRTLKLAGAARSLWSNGALALFAQGTLLMRLNPDYTATSLRSDLAPNLTVAYQQVNDRVYFTNTAQTGVYQSGSVRSWGLPVPGLPVVNATVGLMPAGDYQYTMVYLRSDGQQSGAGLAGRIGLSSGSGIIFTMPVSSDPDVTAKALYLSTPNGDVLYRMTVLSNFVASFTYANDTTELAMPLDTQFLSAPPPGHLLGYYRSRLFVAVGEALFYSEPAAYELFDLRRYLQFDSKVTVFAPIEDRDNPGAFVATENSTGWLQGTDPDSFSFVPCVDYGAILGTMTYIDGSLFADHSAGARMLPMWLSTQGLCVGLPGGQVRNLTRARYQFNVQGTGCALFRTDSTQYIAVANS